MPVYTVLVAQAHQGRAIEAVTLITATLVAVVAQVVRAAVPPVEVQVALG
jgi:hypothetical protein